MYIYIYIYPGRKTPLIFLDYFCRNHVCIGERGRKNAAIPPTFVSNLWWFCNLYAKILPKMLPGHVQISWKSFQNRCKIHFRRHQGPFGHYFGPLIEKSLILYAKKVVPRTRKCPGEVKKKRKSIEISEFVLVFLRCDFQGNFGVICGGSEPRKSCSRLGETLILAKLSVSKKVVKIIDFWIIFGEKP